MNPSTEIQVQNLDHLGLVAGIIDEIGLVEQINQLVGQYECERVSPGHVVKAIILNALGFVSAPMYLFSRFFEGKATEHLIGEGVKPEHLNDDRLGRVMDKLYLSGLSQLFTLVALGAAKKFGVATGCVHLDSTSFHVHGACAWSRLFKKPGRSAGSMRIICPKWLSSLGNLILMTLSGRRWNRQ